MICFVCVDSVQNLTPTVSVDMPEEALVQEQERIITMSYTLASEASVKSKMVAVPPQANPPEPPSLSASLPSPVPPPPPLPPVSLGPPSPLSNGIHYTFV
ncbi:chitin-binding lectin 1-like [Thalassophryne amazonica]|uniref:chitin-binding lectin 1-like n=1 Tax=Thalassophryne amazonica TaxID=390379 RepID=UPI0014723611|nr:chitin-binding lectin 1-like [Thalassophryne amazonica]